MISGCAKQTAIDDCAQRAGNTLCKGLSEGDEIHSCDGNTCHCEMDSNGNLYPSCTEKGCPKGTDKRCSMPKPKEIGSCEPINGFYYDPSSNICMIISGCSVEELVPFMYKDRCERTCVIKNYCDGHQEGERYPAGDGCNTCVCERTPGGDLVAQCTTQYCGEVNLTT